jgi:O-antigen ligase
MHINSSHWQYRWQRFNVFAVSFLAVSVSLGVAVVSIAKLLILIAVLGQLFLDFKNRSFPATAYWPQTAWWIVLAMLWMSLSGLWTEASTTEALAGWGRHSRMLWFLGVVFLLRTPDQAMLTLKWFVAGMAFMLLSSWALVAGWSVPWATAEEAATLGIVHGSTLEQPILLTLLSVILWFLRDQWPQGRWRWIPISLLLLAVTNVFFVMTGRSGFLVMLVFIFLATWWKLSPKWRWTAWGVPIALAALLMVFSPRFNQRAQQITSDVQSYRSGSIETSQAQRLDYWHRSVMAFAETPVWGHGVGSWRLNYDRLGGLQSAAPSNPHQQYLLWAVEGGGVGLFLFMGVLFSHFRDAQVLPLNAKQALWTITAIAAVLGLMNCPYFGAGMGECLLYLAACLCAMRKENHSTVGIYTNQNLGS